MKLELLCQLGLEATRYLERYVNNIKPGAHSDWSESNILYSPHEGLPQFEAPAFDLPLGAVTVLSANPDPILSQEVIRPHAVRFFLHPEMALDIEYIERVGIDISTRVGETYLVTPTSSTRTLLTKDREYNFMIKTDLERRHYRFIRRLKGSSVDHSIRISRELEKITSSAGLSDCCFLPESLGIVIGDPDHGAGVILREVLARPRLSVPTIMIPYFSLYAPDLRQPSDLPLLIQLLQRNAGPRDALPYFVEQILGRIVLVWSRIASRYGLLLELHGQNTLLEVDADLQPRRLVYRDLQSTYVDEKVRMMCGLDMPFLKHIVGQESGTDVPTQYSVVYDHEIGDFLLNRMICTFRKYYPDFTFEDVAAKIRTIFRSEFPDWRSKFPAETYTYGAQSGNEVNLVRQHAEPVFR